MHMTIALVVFLGFLGLCMGSFAGATVWRLRARQLDEDKQANEEVDAAEYKRLQPLLHKKTTEDRSQCLHCHHVLRWYDLLPLGSWLSLGGKCRYCRKSIGNFEPLMEIITAVAFVGSFLLWDFSAAGYFDEVSFGLWLIILVQLIILCAYDAKWFLLPDRIMWPFIAASAVFAGLRIATATDAVAAIYSLAGAVAILSGIYLILHRVSKGQWIGFGDVKLGLGLAFVLGDWLLAFVALFLANVLALAVVLPGMLRGRIGRNSRVPFGPFLIIATVLALFFGSALTSWYLDLFNMSFTTLP